MMDTEKLYRDDLRSCHRLPAEEVEILLQAYRAGDKAARESIITSLLGNICWYAARLQNKYTPFMELVSVGNAVLVEHFDEALLHPNPIGYLKKFAYGEMVDFRRRLNYPIPLPTGPGHEPYTVLSILDEFNTDEFDIAEETAFAQEDDHTPLYEALDALTSSNAHTLLLRLFGLSGHTQESLTAIAEGDSSTQAYHRKKTMKLDTLKKLRCYLLEHHAQYVRAHTSNTVLKSKGEQYAQALTLPEVTRKKLEQAAQQLITQGQPLSMKRLRELSGVHTSYALAFANQIKGKETA